MSLSGSRPNIVFVFSDDISWRDLGLQGQAHFATPCLDRLAFSGIRFTQAYAGSPECAPSRASVMTGRHMGHCRIRANRSVRGQDHLLASDLTVAEILKRAGYATGFVGKWGIGLPGTEGTPDRKGFDFACGFYDQLRAHTYFPHYLMRNGNVEPLPENYGFNMERAYAYNRRPVENLNDVANTYDAEGRLVPDGVPDPARAKHSEDIFQEEALRFIREHQDESFFLYYATQLPHGPIITPDIGPWKDKNWPIKNKEWAAMMNHMDRGVQRMTDLLVELDILDDTVIVFAGDNGYSAWGYFGRDAWIDDPLFKNKGPWPAGKFICREGGLRVPCFISWLGRIQPAESDLVCALYDLPATFADLAGAPLEASETDGVSLCPTLEGRQEDQPCHEYLYWENGTRKPHAQAVRLGPWHAFRTHPDNPVELYRIEEDPACETDLAASNPGVIARVEAIFDEAHEDSEWFVNPGETKDSIEAKRHRAEASGTMQNPVRPNTTRP